MMPEDRTEQDAKTVWTLLALADRHDRELRRELGRNGTSQRVLTVMPSEIRRLAGFVAVSTCIANVLVPGVSLATPRDLLRYYPPESAVYLAVLIYFQRYDRGSDIDARLQRFHCLLNAAKDATLSWVLAADAPGRGGGPSDELRAAWRQLSLETIDLGQSLHERLLIDAKRDTLWSALAGQLRDAAVGGHPCIAADGTFSPPHNEDGRSAMRIEVDEAVLVDGGDGPVPARLNDISTTGIGLSGVARASPGDSLSVQLANGWRIGSQVVWHSGDRLGARLDRPLASGDPILGWALIRGGARDAAA